MAAIATHRWVLLVLIASAAGEVPMDPTTAWNATTMKLIAAHPRCSHTMDNHLEAIGQPKIFLRLGPTRQPSRKV